MGENSDITNEQLFEFMTKMYSDLNGKIDNMDREMQEGFKEVKNEIKKTNTKIDHEVMPKIDALFDQQAQGSNPPPRKGTRYHPTFVETC